MTEQEYCKELYLSGQGWTQTKLAELYGVSFSSMQKFIQKQHWDKRKNLDNPTNQRKYSCNDNFFSEENALMAYWLGFISADGYCPRNFNGIGMGLARIDREHLEQFKKDTQATNPIKDYTNSLGYENSKIIITSKQMRTDIAKYGIVPAKTFTLQFPNNLKRKYIIDYIRGYFDGDGSVSYMKNQKALRWQICGANSNFLEGIIQFLFDEYKIPKVKVYKNIGRNVYYFQYSTNTTIALFKILYYSDECRYLNRKYIKFKEAIEQHEIDVKPS